MDRRRSALGVLLAFAACTIVAIVVSGTRPAGGQGVAPTVVQGAGYLCALVAAVLLLAGPRHGEHPVERRSGGVILGALTLLLLLDVIALTDGPDGANIGAGFARLVLLVLIGVSAGRLAVGTSSFRRP